MTDAKSLAECILNPRTIALIGASDDPKKVTGRPLAFLQKHGTGARLFPINPNRETVQGVPAVKSLSDIEEPIDLTYILLGTEAAVDALEQCGELGVRVACILADGFAEAGPEGEARQARIQEIVQRTGIRVIGPNSMGVVDLHRNLVCTNNAAFAVDQLKPGRYGVLSQSGSLIGTFLSRGAARGIGFSFLVSLGNEADFSAGSLGSLLVEHEETDAFLLFLETIREPEELARFAAAACELGKPVIAYKLGRSEIGGELAVSHTGALVGSDGATDCFLSHNSIYRADLFDALFDSPPLLIEKARRPRYRKPTATVVTTTGGGGAMVVDRLGSLGVEVVGAGADVRARLAEKGIKLSSGRLVDVTLAGANYDTMKAVLSELVSDPEVGIVIVAIGSSAQFFPELAVHPIVDIVKELRDKAAPVMGFPVPHAPEALRLLSEAGIASSASVEACAEAVAKYLSQQNATPVISSELSDSIATLLNAGKLSGFDEVSAGKVFTELGVSLPGSLVIAPGAELPDPLELTYPLVVKILSSDIQHKSDAGGVVVGIKDRAELQAAVERVQTSVSKAEPHAKLSGILLQEMAKGVGEAMVGLVRDPTVGPVVTLSAGGVLAELYKDTSMRMAPVSEATARQMIEEVTALAPIRGYRNLPKGDVDALAELISRVSSLALYEDVREAEINPVIIRGEGEGVVAVDALIAV